MQKALTFQSLAREGDIDLCVARLVELEKIIDRVERKNAVLLFNLAQLFARISGRNRRILE